MENVMSEQEYQDKYGHTRNVPVSLRTDETHEGIPFIITVGYKSNRGSGNCHRAVELDHEIMPYIRRAIARYKKNRKPKWKDHRAL